MDKNFTSIAIRGSISAALLIVVGAFIYGLQAYSCAINLFGLEKVVVSGNSMLSREEVADLADVSFETSLFDLPLDSIQIRISKNPFVKSVQVSRQFPRTLFIEVKEREPIAYLNLGRKFLCVDADRFVMPLPSSAGMGLPLPIFSGFDATDSITSGTRVTTYKLTQMVNVLTEIKHDYPRFHNQISELTRNRENEYTIYTSENATKIYLGQEELSQKVQLLAAFWNTLGDRRTWADYDYIDLRYRKQVVVHERT